MPHTRRGVEQLAARRAHNPEAAGSSPAPAKNFLRRSVSKNQETLFYLTFLLFSGGRTAELGTASPAPKNALYVSRLK